MNALLDQAARLIDLATSWYALPLGAAIFLLTFGFAPGMVLRLLVMVYPTGDPRRTELVAELYAIGNRLERLLFVGEQLETALCEGIALRYRRRRDRRSQKAMEHGYVIVQNNTGYMLANISIDIARLGEMAVIKPPPHAPPGSVQAYLVLPKPKARSARLLFARSREDLNYQWTPINAMFDRAYYSSKSKTPRLRRI